MAHFDSLAVSSSLQQNPIVKSLYHDTKPNIFYQSPRQFFIVFPLTPLPPVFSSTIPLDSSHKTRMTIVFRPSLQSCIRTEQPLQVAIYPLVTRMSLDVTSPRLVVVSLYSTIHTCNVFYYHIM
jgi:hypothetical protein